MISTNQENKKRFGLLVTIGGLYGNIKQRFIKNVDERGVKLRSKTTHGRYSIGDYLDSF